MKQRYYLFLKVHIISLQILSELINDIQKKYKTSSIIITHDIECARMTADRLIMLKDGEVYEKGSLVKFEKSTDEVIRAFFK